MERQVHERFFSPSSTYSLIWGMTIVMLCRAQGKVMTENETVPLERPASLKCSLSTLQEALIVTWQKLTKGRPENIATYSTAHGVVIQKPYQNKIEMTQQGLSESTITFLRTTPEDEQCYSCIFNIFGSEAVSGKTCLKLYVQPTVFLNYEFSGDHLNVTCSAIGRPAPVISWKVSGLVAQNTNESNTNLNGTTSVTSTLHIKDFENWVEKKIVCNVQHMESMMEYSVTPSKEGHHFSVPIMVSVLVSVLLLLALILLLFYWKYRRQSRGKLQVEVGVGVGENREIVKKKKKKWNQIVF
ncbi:OX-2 membrane glycoprotein-like isoform X2 [Gracilinanus agilis]|uniref:OX-2 membrane glycoprotein-like isoform X2 n=1 Tax=Gracilinanus agilis TaxID=191870 RepID=UPI001CFC9F05|nr:OX-2 membrane glycoprotein-like isoform X2 [Gracilinanus agilis]